MRWSGRWPARTPKICFCATRRGRCTSWWRRKDAVIELKSLHRVLGASGRFSFASADIMRDVLGVEPGSVTPFAVINDKAGQVTVVLDAAMMAQPVLNFHPLVNTATTTVSREDLVKFLESTGHVPRVAAVSIPPA